MVMSNPEIWGTKIPRSWSFYRYAPEFFIRQLVDEKVVDIKRISVGIIRLF